MKKTILITGSTSGIGAGLAVAFAKSGYDIALNARNSEDCETLGQKVLKECESLGAKAKCFVADVSDFKQCKTMVDEVIGEFGKIDVLINNAGITRDGLLVQMSEENYTDVINVNLNSVFNMCRHVTPFMMKKRAGSIINISSVVGIYGNKGQVNYAASKAGIIGITKSLAKEMGRRNIICNAIAPGFVESPMTDQLEGKVQKQMLDSVALGRYGTVADIAEVALFLASTTYVTGQAIIVDGGLSM